MLESTSEIEKLFSIRIKFLGYHSEKKNTKIRCHKGRLTYSKRELMLHFFLCLFFFCHYVCVLQLVCLTVSRSQISKNQCALLLSFPSSPSILALVLLSVLETHCQLSLKISYCSFTYFRMESASRFDFSGITLP